MSETENNVPPVFICGYPKSGTTLLLALLDRHPDLLVFPEETTFFDRVMFDPQRGPQRKTPEYMLKISAFSYGEFEWQSGYRDYRSIDFDEYSQRLNQRWEASDKSNRALLEATILAYGDVTGQQDKRYWVEKSPESERYIADALTAWPDMRAVYILRDPRDNFCAYRKHKANKKNPQILLPADFITGWGQSLYTWLAFAQQHPYTLFMRYTDLVKNPREELARLCDFLGIAWDDILLEPTRNGVFWSGNSTDKIKHAGISTASLGKYRDVMTAAEREFFQQWLGPVLAHYQFEIDDIRASWRDRVRDKFKGIKTTPQMEETLQTIQAILGITA